MLVAAMQRGAWTFDVCDTGPRDACVASAGLGFVWCEPMQSARLSCCCPHELAFDLRVSRECCEERVLDGLDDIERTERAPRTAASPLVAILPRDMVLEPIGVAPAALDRRDPSARAGPPGFRLHARISVFLI